MVRQTFPRDARLTCAKEFQRVFRHRRMIADRYFKCYCLPGDTPRLGLVVGRRVSRKAVVRNRIRRMIRESFRHRRALLPPVDLVVQARGLAAEASPEALARSLDELWRRLADKPNHCRVIPPVIPQ